MKLPVSAVALSFVFVAAGVLILVAVGLGMVWRADRLLSADAVPSAV